MPRIHIILSPDEKERFRQQAKREGKALAEWLREAAREHLEAAEQRPGIRTVEELQRFFAECDAREGRPEPGWDEHRRLIERSIVSGAADT